MNLEGETYNYPTRNQEVTGKGFLVAQESHEA